MARGRAIDPDLRATIEGALLAGLALADICRKYRLPKSTVHRIKSQLGPSKLEQVGTESRVKLDELLLDALTANLKAQSSICGMASDVEYLRTQPASELARLYGTLSDSAVRLLEAKSYGEEGAAAA